MNGNNNNGQDRVEEDAHVLIPPDDDGPGGEPLPWPLQENNDESDIDMSDNDDDHDDSSEEENVVTDIDSDEDCSENDTVFSDDSPTGLAVNGWVPVNVFTNLSCWLVLKLDAIRGGNWQLGPPETVLLQTLEIFYETAMNLSPRYVDFIPVINAQAICILNHMAAIFLHECVQYCASILVFRL